MYMIDINFRLIYMTHTHLLAERWGLLWIEVGTILKWVYMCFLAAIAIFFAC
jgi:hypothetical protein